MGKKIQANILIVDDDPGILTSARLVLKQSFERVETENDPHNIVQRIEDHEFDAVLLDMNFTSGFTSGNEGLRWLKKIKKERPNTRVVLMTAFGEISLAVRAMKEGASDFVLKPWANEELIETLARALREEGADHKLKKRAKVGDSGQLIGTSPPMQQIYTLIRKVAATDANVLVLGENGTGKELVARALHQQSLRSGKPFVHVDLGAIPETLFESELFGHVKGAFTDARENRKGRFEAASGGSLFLDEIGNLSPALQSKMLTALQNRKITPVGSNTPIAVDVRLITATNMSLTDGVRDQTFRQDLLYRINTVEIRMPALRERSEDIPLLLDHFLASYSKKYDRIPLHIGADVLAELKRYAWPGNVRELQHAVERTVIMESTDSLIPIHSATPQNQMAADEDMPYKLEELEKRAIQRTLERHDGNVSKAARELGLGRTTLYRKMEKYGL